jgi:hypothetical protein
MKFSSLKGIILFADVCIRSEFKNGSRSHPYIQLSSFIQFSSILVTGVYIFENPQLSRGRGGGKYQLMLFGRKKI